MGLLFVYASLIRLRVDYTGFDLFDSFNDIRFVQKFSDQVANAKTMINLYKKRDYKTLKANEIKLDFDAIKISNEQLQHVQRVEDSIQTYFDSTTDVSWPTNEKRPSAFFDAGQPLATARREIDAGCPHGIHRQGRNLRIEYDGRSSDRAEPGRT